MSASLSRLCTSRNRTFVEVVVLTKEPAQRLVDRIGGEREAEPGSGEKAIATALRGVDRQPRASRRAPAEVWGDRRCNKGLTGCFAKRTLLGVASFSPGLPGVSTRRGLSSRCAPYCRFSRQGCMEA